MEITMTRVTTVTPAMPAPHSGGTAPTVAYGRGWLSACSPALHLRQKSVRALNPFDLVPSLAGGRGVVAAAANHDGIATSGPPRGEPR